MVLGRGRLLLLLVALGATVLTTRALLALRVPTVGVAAEWPRLVDVTVINPGGARRPRQTITMRDGRVESITDIDEHARASLADLFQKRYVLPGLIDMNVRFPALPGLRQALGVYFLYAGVTTVRDVGNFDGDLAAFQRGIEANEILFPRLVACGQVIEGDPATCPQSQVMRSAADALPMVDRLIAAGARCVRVHENLAPELRAAIRLAARNQGLPVIEPPEGPGGAAASGAETWLRQLRTIAPGGTEVLIPTLLPWALGPEGAGSAFNDQWLGFLPRAYHGVVRRQEEAVRAIAAGCGASARAANACTDAQTIPFFAIVDAMRPLRADGARVVVGTGTPRVPAPPGFSMHYEMQFLHAAGLSLEEVWVAATRAAGEALGVPQLGVIEVGAPADLLVFRDDPTRDLGALMTLEAVVMRGRLYLWQPRMRLTLDHTKYFDRWLYDWGTRARARFNDWWNPEENRACEVL